MLERYRANAAAILQSASRRGREWFEHYPRTSLSVFGLLVLFLAWGGIVAAPPADFPSGATIVIEEGETVRSAAEILERERIVRSAFWFSTYVLSLRGERGLVAGTYVFPEPSSLPTIAGRLTRGAYGLSSVRITVIEGMTRPEIAELLALKLPQVRKGDFLEYTEGKEGRLFPDTYFFLPDVKARQVADTMEANFDEKLATLTGEIAAFGKLLDDVLVMASLLEKEARTEESRRIIAGILWKRLEIGMPLQVDAVFPFIIGKNTYELTLEDLAFDSPYNTYKYRGLPPGPIGNPSLASIEAAIRPITTPYLYYLSDDDGNMHYTATFEEHVRNKERYLR